MPYQFSTSAHINAPEHISELQEKLNILAAAKRSFMRNFTQLTHTMRRPLLNVYITHLRKYLTFLFSSIRSQICLTLNSFSSLISWPRILSKICESLHQDKWVALKIIAKQSTQLFEQKRLQCHHTTNGFSQQMFFSTWIPLWWSTISYVLWPGTKSNPYMEYDGRSGCYSWYEILCEVSSDE